MLNGDERKITIVGAGPVGSLLAMFLAKRGYAVEIFERRPDMRREAVSAGRSINLAISTRGLHALSRVGLEQEALRQAIPMKGRMIHPIQGELAFQAYGKDDSECIHSISRGGLNQLLMTRAEETGRVRIQFNQKATKLESARGQLHLKDERTGEESSLAAVPVIGTDGSASAIRASLLEAPGSTCEQDYLEYGYKELTIPAAAGGGFRLEKNALHIWPRGTYMLIALPNFDGSFTCTLFLPFHGPLSFEALHDARSVEDFFQAQFPDARPLMPDLTETFFANPTGHMVTVKCWPWSQGGQALLVGDASHAIVPFFGQGMNCGFEDCEVLDQILGEQSGGAVDWSRVFADFAARRRADTDAIANMAVENFVEMRDKVGSARFLLEKEVEKILQKRFGDRYRSRYSLVTFSRVPYRLAWEAGRIEDEILDELCQGLTKADQVNLERADALIQEKLSNLFGNG